MSNASTQDIIERIAELFDQGQSEEARALLFDVLTSYQSDTESLRAQLQALKKRLFGPRTEKIPTEQLALFEALAASGDGAKTDQAPAIDTAPLSPDEWAVVKEHRRKKISKGQLDLSQLPHRIVDMPVPEEEKLCPHCNHERKQIGIEQTRSIERIPSRFEVVVYNRAKLACNHCKEDKVYEVKAPAKPIDKSPCSVSLLVDIITAKYDNHIPLERLHKIYKQEGLTIPQNTLMQWVSHAALMFESLAQRLKRQALASGVLQTDDTPITVLDKEAQGGSKRGRLWAYLGDEKHLWFDYTPDWKSERPKSILEQRQGYIQADGYKGYDALFADPDTQVSEVGCWSHARRKFVLAIDCDKRAHEAVRYIKQLYRLEELARAKGFDATQIQKLREQRARPILKRLKQWLDKLKNKVPPKEPLGKAITYADNQWTALQRYVEDGRLNIDNNAAERALRQIALGRKNWMFAGSDAGARHAAVLYSVIGSARLAGVDVRAYLTFVMQRIVGGCTSGDIESLLPNRWAQDGAQKMNAQTIGVSR